MPLSDCPDCGALYPASERGQSQVARGGEMNTTDQALKLYRKLQAAYRATNRAPRLARIKYRAYRRWLRRDAALPGTIRPALEAHHATE